MPNPPPAKARICQSEPSIRCTSATLLAGGCQIPRPVKARICQSEPSIRCTFINPARGDCQIPACKGSDLSIRAEHPLHLGNPARGGLPNPPPAKARICQSEPSIRCTSATCSRGIAKSPQVLIRRTFQVTLRKN
ncbi:hypothetical protein QUF80_12890 [Desulfococcaceae bacterium HSG8]|nr:hypothetical protein [Desulfococcaceae bacterium HSG8]